MFHPSSISSFTCVTRLTDTRHNFLSLFFSLSFTHTHPALRTNQPLCCCITLSHKRMVLRDSVSGSFHCSVFHQREWVFHRVVSSTRIYCAYACEIVDVLICNTLQLTATHCNTLQMHVRLLMCASMSRVTHVRDQVFYHKRSVSSRCFTVSNYQLEYYCAYSCEIVVAHINESCHTCERLSVSS